MDVGKTIDKIEREKVTKNLDNYIDGLLERIESLEKENIDLKSGEEISKLNSKIKELRTNSIYVMNSVEFNCFRKFRDSHYKSCKGETRFIISGTSLGEVAEVECDMCNKKTIITDFSTW